MYGYWFVDRTIPYNHKAVWSYDLQIQSNIPEPTKTMKGDLMWSSSMIPLVNNQTKMTMNNYKSSGSDKKVQEAVLPLGVSSSNNEEVTDLIVMLPGNPGVVEWYTEMMNSITVKSRGKVAMLTVGFLGHHSGRVSSGGWNNVARLQEQIEAVGQFFKTVIVPSVVEENSTRKSSSSPVVRLHIAGHSIGAFVASHMAARFPEIDGRCFLLAPTICNMLPSPNGTRNNKFVNAPTVTVFSALAGLISLITPRSVQKRVVSLVESNALNEAQMEIAMDMGAACPGMLYNMLTMARSEFDELGSIDPHILGMIGGERLVAYYVQHDGWVPLSDVALFRQNCPEGSKVIMDEDPAVPHAFVLNYSERVVDQAIAPFIQALQS